MRWMAFSTVGIVLGGGSLAGATQFAYEPFLTGPNPAAGQYASFTPPESAENPFVPLVGQNPTNSYFAGGWTNTDANLANAYIQPNSISFGGTSSQGGALVADFESRQRRNLATPWTATTVGTYYMGFMVNFGSGNFADGIQNDDMGYRATEIYNSDGGFLMGITYNTYGSRIGPAQQNPLTGRMFADFSGAPIGGGDVIIENAPDSFVEDGTTHLVVLKFNLSADNAADSILVYLDPQSVDEPVIPGASISNVNVTVGAISGIVRFGSFDGPSPVFDELRIGDSFLDVVPEFPLPGDTNNDDLVDLLDYQNIIAHMNLSGPSVPSTLELHPDVTGDGKVTIADYRRWKDNRTDLTPGSGAGGSGAVPEPASLPLLLAGCVVVASIRNRR